MNAREREFYLSISALRLYAKVKGMESIGIEDLNTILETSPNVIRTVLDRHNCGVGEFRRMLKLSNNVSINNLESSVLFAAWRCIASVLSE